MGNNKDNNDNNNNNNIETEDNPTSKQQSSKSGFGSNRFGVSHHQYKSGNFSSPPLSSPLLSPPSPPLLMILWQAKLAELKKQNKELEKRMKLMAHQYGRLIDRLSNQSNVLWNISRSIYKWNNRHWNGVADDDAPAVLCHPNYQMGAWLVV